MVRIPELPEKLPIFPLSGALLLPRGRLPLQIFEPRYLAMLDDVLRSEHRLVGMIQPVVGGDGALYHIGCAGRVVTFSETDDNRYMITLFGASRFRLTKVEEGFAPYLSARVDWSPFAADLVENNHEPSFDRDGFLALLRRYLDAQGLSTDWDAIQEAESEMLTNALSMLGVFSVDEKQALLEASTVPERRKVLVSLIEFALAGGSMETKQ